MPDVAIDSDSATINSVNLTEQGSDPATPASSHWRLYTKAGGLYLIDDTGAVTGPLGGGGDLVNPMTTPGDLIVGGTAGAPERLGVGSPGDYLGLVDGLPAWTSVELPVSNIYALPSSSPPGSPQLGDLWFETDTGNVYYRDVVSWLLVATHPPASSPPAAATWTWVNQSTATLVDDHGSLLLTTPNTGSFNWRLAVKALPTVPFTASAHFQTMSAAGALTNAAVGVFFRQDAAGGAQGYLHGALALYSATSGYPTIYSTKFTSPSSAASNYSSINTANCRCGDLWLRIVQDLTNREVWYSNNGVDWEMLHQVAAADFLTPDQIGFGASGGGQVMKCRLLSWEVVES